MKKIIMSVLLAFSLLTVAPFSIAASININTATAEHLADQLKGIGLVKAKAIVDYREKNGIFVTMSDLVKVKGIGANIVAKNKDMIVLKSTENQKKQQRLKGDK